MKRPDRVLCYLNVGKQRIAIRSSTVAQKLHADAARIASLAQQLETVRADRERLRARCHRIEASRWNRLGAWLRFVRN